MSCKFALLFVKGKCPNGRTQTDCQVLNIKRFQPSCATLLEREGIVSLIKVIPAEILEFLWHFSYEDEELMIIQIIILASVRDLKKNLLEN